MKLKDELERIGIATLIVVMTGLIGSFASVLAFGWLGFAISFILLVIVIGACYLLLQPVLVKNMRGVRILEAVKNIGLVDIENRNETSRSLPPEKIYEASKQEIAITGITALGTFKGHIRAIHRTLQSGKWLYVLLLDPRTSDATLVSTGNERQNVSMEIMQTIDIIKREELHKYPRFKIKFMGRLPPFTAVMIDGDITNIETPLDHEAQIRVQPVRLHSTHHSGIVLQLKKMPKTADHEVGPFDFFAEDLRKQWKDGIEWSDIVKDSI